MFCARFNRVVHVTRHARARMATRGIDDAGLLDLLETGQTRYKDDVRLWVAKSVPGREDNPICAAITLEDRLVVKTVMHHFRWEV